MARKDDPQPFISFPGEGEEIRCCTHPECGRPGDYPAPKSRADLTDYVWFCLDHIREYNKSWNYCEGMDTSEIEQRRSEDVTWRRPTWPLGYQPWSKQSASQAGFADSFGLFGDESPDPGAGHRANGGPGASPALGPLEREALDVMQLCPPVDLEAVRHRYKELVKRLHPDANGGDKQAEERLKLINQAYSTLKNSHSIR